MAKQMVFDDEARQPLLAGVSKLARAVVSTLGPRGRNAVLDNDCVFGTVNANRRHYEMAAASLAEADQDWLARLITR